jgi:hypothetical protein
MQNHIATHFTQMVYRMMIFFSHQFSPQGRAGISAKLFLRRGTVESLLKKKGIAGRSNIERPTSNVEWEKMKKQTYDLEERLLEYSVRNIKIVEQLPNTKAGNHVGGQLLRSGTSPYPNHGEAQAAESPKDFIHKLRISNLNY